MLTNISNILINVEIDKHNRIKWNDESSKSLVISDYQMFEASRAFGSAGWAPPEQWLGRLTRFELSNVKVTLRIVYGSFFTR